jgi:DNA-binding HxlR family transcriptional regulator
MQTVEISEASKSIPESRHGNEGIPYRSAVKALNELIEKGLVKRNQGLSDARHVYYRWVGENVENQ